MSYIKYKLRIRFGGESGMTIPSYSESSGMAGFRTNLVITPAGNRRWRLTTPLIYDTGTKLLEVPAGFVTNLLSSPRVVWWLIPPTGRYSAAAALHDWLYSGDKGFTREQADELFRETLKELKVSRWKRKIMVEYVRYLGWVRWKGVEN